MLARLDPWFGLAGLLRILPIVFCTNLSGATIQDQPAADPQRQIAKTEAVVWWVGLTILAVSIVGIGLIWGASRLAKRIHRMRPPTQTEMKNIWYLNPPESRKQDDRE